MHRGHAYYCHALTPPPLSVILTLNFLKIVSPYHKLLFMLLSGIEEREMPAKSEATVQNHKKTHKDVIQKKKSLSKKGRKEISA